MREDTEIVTFKGQSFCLTYIDIGKNTESREIYLEICEIARFVLKS